MELSQEEVRKHCKRYHTANEEIVEKYLLDNPKEVYTFEDLDAIYQIQVEHIKNMNVVFSAKNRHTRIAGGGTGTMSGTKYGNSYL